MSGMELPLAVMITIPEPWAKQPPDEPEERKDFYQYYANDDGAVGWPGIHRVQ